MLEELSWSQILCTRALLSPDAALQTAAGMANESVVQGKRNPFRSQAFCFLIFLTQSHAAHLLLWCLMGCISKAPGICMWGYYSDYRAFRNQHTTGIHQSWLTPPFCLFPVPLPPLSFSLISTPQHSHPCYTLSSFLHKLLFPTTEHPLLSCCLMRPSIHLSVLSQLFACDQK